jgi:hypothetical protein
LRNGEIGAGSLHGDDIGSDAKSSNVFSEQKALLSLSDSHKNKQYQHGYKSIKK